MLRARNKTTGDTVEMDGCTASGCCLGGIALIVGVPLLIIWLVFAAAGAGWSAFQ